MELAAEMHDYIKEDLSVHFPSLKVWPLALHLYPMQWGNFPAYVQYI